MHHPFGELSFFIFWASLVLTMALLIVSCDPALESRRTLLRIWAGVLGSSALLGLFVSFDLNRIAPVEFGRWTSMFHLLVGMGLPAVLTFGTVLRMFSRTGRHISHQR
jgi:hypothetical protein